MPDNTNNLLSGLGDVSYTPQEKKGAPQIEAPELDDILAPPPAQWTGGGEKKGAPKVDEPVLLDDPAQNDWQKPAQKLGAPQIEAPELDAGTAYTEKRTSSAPQMPADAAADLLGDAPAVYDPVEEFYKKLRFSDSQKATFVTLPEEKQRMIVEKVSQQLGIAPPSIPKQLLPKTEEKEEALPDAQDIGLEEAPKPQEYVPQFKDEDLERIKEESKKPQKYVPPQVEMTAEQKKESVRIMNALREERERELAQKGFKQLILLSILGVVGAVTFTLFFSGAFGLGYKLEDELGWMKTIKDNAIYFGAAMGLCSILLAAPVPAFKSLAKVIDLVGTVLMLFPGIPMLIQKEPGNGLLNGVLFGVSLLLCGLSFVILVTSEGIHMYDKHGNG